MQELENELVFDYDTSALRCRSVRRGAWAQKAGRFNR
jgi:hypothetical protein